MRREARGAGARCGVLTIQTAESLGRELLARNLAAPKDVADLEMPHHQLSALDDDRAFMIAYYVTTPDNSLNELRVRSFDKSTRHSARW